MTYNSYDSDNAIIMKTNDTTRPGFTLLEVSLVIGVLAVILTMTLAVSKSAIGRAGLRAAENIVVQGIRRAQTMSQNNVGGSTYGVYINEGTDVVVFSGATYATRSSAHDQEFEINENITFSGTLYDKMTTGSNGIVFERLTGDPTPANYSGTIILTLIEETKTLTVNGKGVIER